MAIRFLTDSTADILPEEAARRDIDIVPLKVLFGETAYRDGIDLDHSTFYKMLTEAEQLPTTSQPTPDDFLPYFEKAKVAGDSLICLLLSAALSGTYQSACIARDICGYDQIYVVDSTLAIVALRAMLDLGEQLREQGLPAAQIVEQIEHAKTRMRIFAIVDTLEYLHKGGRMSTSVAIVGSLLKVKPVITLKDGTLGLVSKGVGTKGSMSAMMKVVGDEIHPDPRLPIYYGYTDHDGLCRQFIGQMETKFGLHTYEVYSVGSVIGTHLGPGGAIIAYLEESQLYLS